MKQYTVLFEINFGNEIDKHYMIATENTTVCEIEKFCRNHDHFGKTTVTITELEANVDMQGEIEGKLRQK